jgi:S-adenosylmethionine decarboxylase
MICPETAPSFAEGSGGSTEARSASEGGPAPNERPVGTGVEWLVDAFGCEPSALRSRDALESVFARAIRDLSLHRAAPAVWHTFDGEAGITGLLLLTESHLTCHSFPELGFVAFNLYSCAQRPAWPWERHLAELLGAQRVVVRELARG